MSDLFTSGIRPAVDAYLAKKAAEERNYGEYWSASSGGYCMRLNIMKRLKVPKVPELEDNATQTRIFESGHIFHEWMQRITKDAGLSIASEVELQDETLMIRGHFDDLIAFEYGDDKPQTHLILYDYKTAHSASFKFSMGRPISHYHKMQLGTYMHMLRKPVEGIFNIPLPVNQIKELSEARIMSISKDDLRQDEKQLLWTPDLEKEVVDYWTTLNKYWADKKMPPCTCLDHEGGFMGKRSAKGKVYNDFFYNDEPCSLAWYEECKAKGLIENANLL